MGLRSVTGSELGSGGDFYQLQGISISSLGSLSSSPLSSLRTTFLLPIVVFAAAVIISNIAFVVVPAVVVPIIIFAAAVVIPIVVFAAAAAVIVIVALGSPVARCSCRSMFMPLVVVGPTKPSVIAGVWWGGPVCVLDQRYLVVVGVCIDGRLYLSMAGRLVDSWSYSLAVRSRVVDGWLLQFVTLLVMPALGKTGLWNGMSANDENKP